MASDGKLLGKRSLGRWHWACFFVLVLSAAVYGASLAGAPIWEDERLIGGRERSVAECFTNPFLGGYFRPLVTLSFYLDRQLAGREPFLYHQTNILIHVLTTTALLGAFRAAFRSRRAALFGALLFAVQPAQVSAVAWIGGRTDSLCVLWASCVAWALLRAAEASGRARGAWMGGASAFFALALLTKEQSVALLPLAPLALATLSPPDRRPGWRGAVVASLPMLGVAVAFALLWKAVGPGFLKGADHGWAYRLTLGGQSLLYYALLLAVPTPKTMHLLTTTSLRDISPLGTALLGYVALGLCLAAFWRWRRVAPAAAWWMAWTVLLIIPVANWVPVTSLIVASYRGALAGVGAAALLGWMASQLWEKGAAGRGIALAYAAAMVVLTGWGVTRWNSARVLSATLDMHDPGSLFVREGQIALLMSGDSHADHTKDAHHEGEEEPEANPAGAAQVAEAYLTWAFGGDAWRTPEGARRAMDENPSVVARIHDSNGDKRPPRQALADLLTLLGYARMELENLLGAQVAFETGEMLDPSNPSVALAQGRWQIKSRNYAQAISFLNKAIARAPNVPTGFILRGLCFEKLGRWREAADSFAAAIPLEPWAGRPYLSLAAARRRAGDLAGEREALEQGRQKAITEQEQIQARLDQLSTSATR